MKKKTDIMNDGEYYSYHPVQKIDRKKELLYSVMEYSSHQSDHNFYTIIVTTQMPSRLMNQVIPKQEQFEFVIEGADTKDKAFELFSQTQNKITEYLEKEAEKRMDKIEKELKDLERHVAAVGGMTPELEKELREGKNFNKRKEGSILTFPGR